MVLISIPFVILYFYLCFRKELKKTSVSDNSNFPDAKDAIKNTKDFIKKYADKFFDIVDETYADIYGSVPFTDNTRKMMISNHLVLIKKRIWIE